MIDRTKFTERFSILLDRYGRTMGAPSVKEYFEILNRELDTSAFLEASRVIFREDQFFPTPQRFIEAVRGDPKAASEEAWNALLAAASKGDGQAVTPEALSTLRALGVTFRDVSTSSEYQLGQIGKRFLAAHQREPERRETTSLPGNPLNLGRAS